MKKNELKDENIEAAALEYVGGRDETKNRNFITRDLGINLTQRTINIKPNYLEHLLKYVEKTPDLIGHYIGITYSDYLDWISKFQPHRIVVGDCSEEVFSIGLLDRGENRHKIFGEIINPHDNLVKFLPKEAVPSYEQFFLPLYEGLNIDNNILNLNNDIKKQFEVMQDFFVSNMTLGCLQQNAQFHNVSVFYPFLYTPLVKIALNQSGYLKRLSDKKILKKIAEGYLPHSIIYQEKIGLSNPFYNWIKEENFSEEIKDFINQSKFEYINKQYFLNLIDENKNIDGKGKAKSIFSYIAFLAWYENWIMNN